jgi:hypothetical protein
MSAEQALAPVRVTLGGREFTLRLTLRAVREIKQRIGADVFTGGIPAAEMVDHLGTLLWALVRHKGEGGDQNLTVEDIEDMVDAAELPGILAALGATMEQDGGPRQEAEACAAGGDAPLAASSTS